MVNSISITIVTRSVGLEMLMCWGFLLKERQGQSTSDFVVLVGYQCLLAMDIIWTS